jgi:hypothetical protein
MNGYTAHTDLYVKGIMNYVHQKGWGIVDSRYIFFIH